MKKFDVTEVFTNGIHAKEYNVNASTYVKCANHIYRVSVDCGNCYFHAHVSIKTLNGDFVNIADGTDFTNVHIDYIWSADEKTSKVKEIFDDAYKFIKAIASAEN